MTEGFPLEPSLLYLLGCWEDSSSLLPSKGSTGIGTPPPCCLWSRTPPRSSSSSRSGGCMVRCRAGQSGPRQSRRRTGPMIAWAVRTHLSPVLLLLLHLASDASVGHGRLSCWLCVSSKCVAFRTEMLQMVRSIYSGSADLRLLALPCTTYIPPFVIPASRSTTYVLWNAVYSMCRTPNGV